MSIIRLTKEFSFEMAHALEGYDGACSQIHGHSYRMFVTVRGLPRQDDGDPKQGMVMDFGALKKIVNESVVDVFDHALVIRESGRSLPLIEALRAEFQRIITVPWQPTCENMIADFAVKIRAGLPAGIELHSLKMHETATSFAEWFAEDN